MRSVLVTGGTGLLGKGFEETAPKGVSIVSVHLRDYKVPRGRAEHVSLDLRDKRAVEKLFAKRRFDAVIHAAGIASVDYVERHYAESLESNIVSTLNVTAACRTRGIHHVYVSTNAVFDGTDAPYRESDATNPVNKYGRLKVECERLVQETLGSWTIVRPILMYGWNRTVTRPNPATWIHEKLMRGESVELVDDVRENPLYNLQCGRALWAALRRKPKGIIHLAGKDRVNRWQFGLKVAETFGLDKSLIKRVDSSRFPSIAARPPDTSFDTGRMRRELGIAPMTVEEGLRDMKRHMEAGA
ncbi:MAG: SDR family oxidoreductase [Elusimicrobiota bacterium]|nr:MAG: SDR family oxidoreductase [Elusimicrobiota bacterium]